jgi:hypothetical protein
MKKEQETKIVLEKGIAPWEYEVYDDGSAKVKCSSCGIVDEVSPERGVKFISKDDWYKTYICLDCWKIGKEKEKTDSEEKRIEGIIWGQSWNLAAYLTAPIVKGIMEDASNKVKVEEIIKTVEAWQVYFYKKLNKQ